MTAKKKTGEFSGKPGRRSKAHDKYRLDLAYAAVQKGMGIPSALKRACLAHPHGLKPPELVEALLNVQPHVGKKSKIMLKHELTPDQRVYLGLEVERLRKLFESNKKFYGETWFVDPNLAAGPDHDAYIEDELGRVRLPR